MLKCKSMTIMSGNELLDAMDSLYFNLYLNDDETLGSHSELYKELTLDRIEYDIRQIIMMARPVFPHYYSEDDIRNEITRVRSHENFNEAREFRLCLPHCSELFYDLNSDVENLIRSSEPTDPYLSVLTKIYKIFHDWKLEVA